MSDWDKVYGIRNMTMWEPQQSIVQFVNRFIKKRIAYDKYKVINNYKKVLDLGCGNGSAVHFLAKNKFDVYGVDISDLAIEIAKDFIFQEGLKADLQTCSCDSLPYDDNFFDFIICYGVLDHVPISVAQESIKEIKRTLKSGGLFFCSLISTDSTLFGKGEKVDYHTYLIEEGMEEGEIQHYFDIQEINDLFADFKILDIRQTHEYLYSSDGKKRLDTSSRWFITSELKNE